MLVDDLEKRAIDIVSGPAIQAERTVEILAVGVIWSLPGMLLGLLAAALASIWPDYIVWFGLSGTLIGGVTGLWLESAASALDFPSP